MKRPERSYCASHHSKYYSNTPTTQPQTSDVESRALSRDVGVTEARQFPYLDM